MHYVHVISAVFTPRSVIYPVVIGFFFSLYRVPFISGNKRRGYRIPVTRAATIVFSKAMRFFRNAISRFARA